MKMFKQILLLLSMMVVFTGSAYAHVCYAPRYGYYNCGVVYAPVRYYAPPTCYDPYYGYHPCGYRPRPVAYYAPDPGPALIAGAFAGLLIGSALYNGGGYHHHWHHWH